MNNFICEKCGTSFKSRKKKVRFCSNSCRANALNHANHFLREDGKPYNYRDDVIRNCKVCGKKLHHQNKTGHCRKHYITDEYRKELSKRAIKAGIGGYKPGSGRSKGQWYESPIAGRVYLDSSYEVRYAKYLDENKIQWKKNTKKFPYVFEDKNLNYIPDFYLIESDEYIETKGYKTDKDEAKWKYFSYKLKILFNNNLKELEEMVA